MKPTPNQHKEVEGLVYHIGKLADQVWVYGARLRDEIVIEGDKCVVRIQAKRGGEGET